MKCQDSLVLLRAIVLLKLASSPSLSLELLSLTTKVASSLSSPSLSEQAIKCLTPFITSTQHLT